MTLLLIRLGGFLGAISRYLVDGWVAQATGGTFPFGTLVINVSGSFVLGLLFALTVERGILSPEVRLPVMTGFIGAYTTFSTWMLETLRLAETGALFGASVNIVGSVGLGLGAVFTGLAIGRAL